MRYGRKAEEVEAVQMVAPDRNLDLYAMAGVLGLTKLNRADILAVLLASPGDWIVRHPDGRLSAYAPDDFAATYEPVGV